MSSTSRSTLTTVSFPELLRKTAASSPMPATTEDVTRLRIELMKSNSLLILKDYDEANRALLRWFRSKWKKRSAGGSRLPRRTRYREQLQPVRRFATVFIDKTDIGKRVESARWLSARQSDLVQS